MGKEEAALHCQAVKQSGFQPSPRRHAPQARTKLQSELKPYNELHRDYIRGNPSSPHSSQEAFPIQPRKAVDGVTSPTPQIASSPMVKLPRSFTVTESGEDLQKTLKPTLSETEVTQLGGVHCTTIGEGSTLPVSGTYFSFLILTTSRNPPQERPFPQQGKVQKRIRNGLVFSCKMKHCYVLFMQSENPFSFQHYKLNLLL